jgi:hypothetical protein
MGNATGRRKKPGTWRVPMVSSSDRASARKEFGSALQEQTSGRKTITNKRKGEYLCQLN